jgi:hypothetical protein
MSNSLYCEEVLGPIRSPLELLADVCADVPQTHMVLYMDMEQPLVPPCTSTPALSAFYGRFHFVNGVMTHRQVCRELLLSQEPLVLPSMLIKYENIYASTPSYTGIGLVQPWIVILEQQLAKAKELRIECRRRLERFPHVVNYVSPFLDRITVGKMTLFQAVSQPGLVHCPLFSAD